MKINYAKYILPYILLHHIKLIRNISVIENGICDPSSNSERSCLRFISR